MIERTRRKQGEARFFYGSQHFRHDPAAFRYYFSAFIQAARSITWTRGNEEPQKWKAWERTWRAKRSTEEQKLLDLTNELRLIEAKRGGTNPSIELEEVALHELLRSEGVEPWKQHPAYGGHVFAPPGVPPPKTLRPAYYFEQEDGKQEVTALCERYLEFLEKMLNDFCADHQPGSEDA